MSLNDELWNWLGKKPEGDFTTDNLCFKWLVPKLKHWEIHNWVGKSVAYALTPNGWHRVEAETPALALCLAISKLIEKDIDKGK